MITLVLGSMLIVGTVPVAWWALSGERPPSRRTRAASAKNLVARGMAPTTDLREALLTHSARDRAVQPAVEKLAGQARRFTPGGMISGMEKRLLLAGSPPKWNLDKALAMKVTFGLAGLGMGFLLLVGGNPLGRFLLVGLPVLGWFTPDLLLKSKAQERQAEIQLALPDTLDQITISVEAGLGFDAALSRVAKSGEGPLADEILRTLQDMHAGMPRAQALKGLATRTEVPELKHFVSAVVQASTYGVPIAQVLRVQSAELRVKRRQRAEEQAMKLPVKVLFPLVLCILPCLFIVILGPAAIRIVQGFSA